MKNKGLKIGLLVVGLLLLAYFIGPRVGKSELSPDLPTFTLSCDEVEAYVMGKESTLSIRPGNGSRIIWADDSLRQPTPYVLLYLHGFSASPVEGDPVHTMLAERFGMNAYLPLLWDHGLETEEALLNMTAGQLWESAKEALVLAHRLGEKVIIASTSTGGTLALKLAADYPDLVDGLVLYSPNVRIANKAVFLSTRPWGRQITKLFTGGDYRVVSQTEEEAPYWYGRYRIEGIIYLQQLVELTMQASLFKEVKTPAFIGYYYKDEDNQDNTVSVDAILWMADNLGTLPELKVSEAFPDAGAHVIACSITNENWMKVFEATSSFLTNKLGLQAVN